MIFLCVSHFFAYLVAKKDEGVGLQPGILLVLSNPFIVSQSGLLFASSKIRDSSSFLSNPFICSPLWAPVLG